MADKLKKTKIKKLAILASGGNAPGMNNVIIGFVKVCLFYDIEPILIYEGYKGLHRGNFKSYNATKLRSLEEFAFRGNVAIQSSRFPEMLKEKVQLEVANQIFKNNIDALIVVGGDGSYRGAEKLAKLGVKVVTLPATIDNDVNSTDVTIGFDSALNQVCRSLSDLIDCFGSHDGVNIVEIMGRDCSDLTVTTGIGNNISHIVTKENILDMNGFLEVVKKAKANGMKSCSILITEKIYGKNGLPHLYDVAKVIEKKTGHLTRYTPIGYIQRGGSPSASDRALANLMITEAVEMLMDGKYNKAMCSIANKIVAIDLESAINATRKSNNKSLVRKFNKINKI